MDRKTEWFRYNAGTGYLVNVPVRCSLMRVWACAGGGGGGGGSATGGGGGGGSGQSVWDWTFPILPGTLLLVSPGFLGVGGASGVAGGSTIIATVNGNVSSNILVLFGGSGGANGGAAGGTGGVGARPFTNGGADMGDGGTASATQSVADGKLWFLGSESCPQIAAGGGGAGGSAANFAGRSSCIWAMRTAGVYDTYPSQFASGGSSRGGTTAALTDRGGAGGGNHFAFGGRGGNANADGLEPTGIYLKSSTVATGGGGGGGGINGNGADGGEGLVILRFE